MFQQTTFLALLALTTSTFSAPNELERRYQCLPSVPAKDCSAKSNFFNKCADAKILPVATCYAQSLNITAGVNNPVNPAHPWPAALPVAPVPTTAPALDRRYECTPDVEPEECLKRKTRFDNCVANGGVVSECYNNSMLPTLSK